jgi:O-antigen ligase
MLVVGSIYAVGYPFAELLQSISPAILAGSGQYVPLFFNYTNTSVVLLASVSYVMLFTSWSHIFTIRHLFTATLLLGFTAFLFQARTIYLQILALLLFFSFYRSKANKRFLYIITAALILLFVISELDLSIEGRLGQRVSATFIKNHFLALFGIESEGVIFAAKGVSQRIEWWRDLLEFWTEKFGSILFGLGYGLPLIDFKIENSVIVREPHNSYISILTRLGILGALVWVWIHILLINVWRKALHICRKNSWRLGENRLLFLMTYFILIWVLAIGEDAFEKPFNAIPYYFFWGIVLRYYGYLKNSVSPIK